MDNPLFGALFSPSPSGAARHANPVWSPGSARTAPATRWASPAAEPATAAPPLPPDVAPPAAGGAAGGVTGGKEAESFARILAAAMRGDGDAADSLVSYADTCRRRAAELR